MPYTLSRRPNYAVEISGRLEPDAVHEERAGILRSMRGTARVPGFRPGKAPLQVLQARFSDEIDSELKEHLAERIWQEVVEGEDDLRPLTSPRVTEAEIEPGGGFRLTAELETRPRFELPEADSLSLPEVPVEVGPAEIDEEIDKLRGEQAVWEPADDAEAEDGVLVEAEVHATFPEGGGEPFSDENAHFQVGSEALFPEISEALQGARAGDERRAVRRIAEDHADENLRGKSIEYRITVKGLKRQALPPVDDELAKGLGLDDLEQLRERIRSAVESRKIAERRSRWRRALLDQLSASLDPNELPRSVVHAALDEDMHRFAYSMAMRGANLESEDFNWQEISAKLEPGARRKALDTLILEQLAEEWQIEVPEEEVDAYVRGEAARLQTPPAEHKANLAREGKLDGIRDAARLAAVVDRLIRTAGGEDSP